MPSEVRQLVDNARPFPVVRLSGVLDGATTGTVRDLLLDVLSGQPPAIVLDVGELTVGEAAAVGVLGEVARATTWWPGARLALCDQRVEVWQGVGWDVFKDYPAAFAELGEPEADRRRSLPLEPQVGAARQCREVIAEACAQWGLESLTGSASIVATEMVNNVVAHARTPMTVLIAAKGDGISIAVRDRSTVVPTFAGAPVSATSPGGRGMLLIDSVAARWGNLPLADGKVVWALLS